MKENPLKTCHECGKTLQGRADKKFCSDSCRSSYNNSLRAGVHDYVRHVHYILRKNHRILTELNARGKRMITIDHLRIHGFDFNHCTSHFQSKDGLQYRYCYDQGFYQREGEEKLVLIHKDLEP